MSTTPRNSTGCIAWRFVLVGIVWVVALAGGGISQCHADDGKGILRVDAATGELLPVQSADLHVGYVYNHFDLQLNRRVWAILEPKGQFSIAMAPGSAQPARLFGFTTASKEDMDLLRRRDPKLAEEVNREGSEPFLKLNSDQKWRLTRTTVPLIYNEATGERWELHFGKYRPISHLHGYSWRRSGERYAPAY